MDNVLIQFELFTILPQPRIFIVENFSICLATFFITLVPLTEFQAFFTGGALEPRKKFLPLCSV